MDCLHLVRPLLEKQTQRNQERAKITTGMQQLGQLWTRRYKRATNCHFGGFGCRSKDCSWSLHKAPPRGSQTTQSFPPARPTTHPHTPTLLPFKELPLPSSRSKQGYLFLVLAPWYCSMGPKKTLPEFVWPLLIKGSKDLGWNILCCLRGGVSGVVIPRREGGGEPGPREASAICAV